MEMNSFKLGEGQQRRTVFHHRYVVDYIEEGREVDSHESRQCGKDRYYNRCYAERRTNLREEKVELERKAVSLMKLDEKYIHKII